MHVPSARRRLNINYPLRRCATMTQELFDPTAEISAVKIGREPWREASSDAKDLIGKLLVLDVAKRSSG